LTEDQKGQFRDAMNLMMQTYNRAKPDADMLRLWWGKLEKYEIAEVFKAFDVWIDTKTVAPTPAEIIDLCRHRVTIAPRLNSPVNIEHNRKQMEEVKREVAKFLEPKEDPKAWAKKILANPKQYPDISVRFAQEALGIKEPA
jgi:hypothetical protein